MGRALHAGPNVSEHELDIRRSLAKRDALLLTAPKYWPRQFEVALARQLEAWCEEHPRSDWPDFVEEWMDGRAADRRMGRDARRPGEGMDGGAARGERQGAELGRDGRDGATAGSQSEAAA
jgi:hypothetical protein